MTLRRQSSNNNTLLIMLIVRSVKSATASLNSLIELGLREAQLIFDLLEFRHQ